MQIRTFRAIAVLMTVSAFLPMAPLLADQSGAVAGELNECAECGEPTTQSCCHLRGRPRLR